MTGALPNLHVLDGEGKLLVHHLTSPKVSTANGKNYYYLPPSIENLYSGSGGIEADSLNICEIR